MFPVKRSREPACLLGTEISEVHLLATGQSSQYKLFGKSACPPYDIGHGGGGGGQFCMVLYLGVLDMQPHLVCAVADVAGCLPNMFPSPCYFLLSRGFDFIQSDSLLGENPAFSWLWVQPR